MTTITIDRAVVEQALSLCEFVHGLRTDDEDGGTVWCQGLIDALRAALARPSPATLFDPRGSLGEPIV